MSIHHPTTGAQLQQAIEAAQGGDEIVLNPVTRYVGEFKLPAKPSRVTIRSSATLDLPEGRISDVSLLPTLASGVNAPVLVVEGAANWLLLGLNIEPTAGFTGGEAIVLQGARNITFDRIRLVSQGGDIKRGIRGNGESITLTRSHIAGIWAPGQDSQAFCAWDGAGPYTITDNFLEAAGENIMFGGADSSRPENLPADILIEGNLCSKRLAWKGDAVTQVIKNLIEFKVGKRITVRRNTFEHCWGGEGQSGYAAMITPRNQDGGAPWSVVEDALFEQNVYRDTDNGIGITGYDDEGGVTGQTTRIVFRDEDIQTRGMVFVVSQEIGELSIYRNTVTVPANTPLLYISREGQILLADGTTRPSQFAVQNLMLAENDAPGTYIHGPEAHGEEALKLYTKAYSFVVPSTEPEPPPVEPPVDPEPPIEPEPPVDIVGPDVRLAVLHRQGKSHNWELRADTDAPDVVKVEFYLNGEVKRTMQSPPFGTTLSFKGYRGSVAVAVQAWDAAGNVGTASRTVVL